jgi:hypothetical protein
MDILGDQNRRLMKKRVVVAVVDDDGDDDDEGHKVRVRTSVVTDVEN